MSVASLAGRAPARILVLGANFAGLATAQKLRDLAGDKVAITVVDRKNYLLFVPNIPADVFEGRDPGLGQTMDVVAPLASDGTQFIQAEIMAIDPVGKTVSVVPNERPGAPSQELRYDYLVVAVGARLAYDRIEGFAKHGHTVSDVYQGRKLQAYLKDGYRGGPVAVGSARFHQGDGARGLAPYPGGSIPLALAACEGPPVEVALSMGHWLTANGLGGPSDVTLFTPAELIAEDAGKGVVKQLLEAASGMGFHYMNKVEDIRRVTAEGLEFADGRSLEAELKILFPDWVPHDFLKGTPIADSEGFVVTDLTMRNPRFPNVFAVGDCAAATVPKLGAIGHQESEIAALQIAKDLGAVSAERADAPLQPIVYCIGDMGGGKGFYIRSNSWYGGPVEVLTMGRVPYQLKMQYRSLFFMTRGRTPGWGLDFAEMIAEKVA